MNPRGSMEQMVAESYEITLKPWHGWISAAAYKVNNSFFFYIYYNLVLDLHIIKANDNRNMHCK